MIPRADADTWTYLGCYTDQVGARTLSQVGYTLGGPGNMTVANCQNGCASQGYSFAGVEYSSECWCDNQLRNGGGPAPDGEAMCSMPCNGNPEEKCGGPGRLNLYQNTAIKPTDTMTTSAPSTETGSPTTTSVPEPTQGLPDGWQYAGCYQDNVNGGRVMFKMLPDSSTLTIESCISMCVNLGYTVAGAEYSKQCFCDNYLRNAAPKAIESECSMTCSGNTQQKCGGPSRLSVYSKGNLTVLPIPVPQTGGLPGGWKYQGCLQ